jgi:hypothetical protein
VTWASTRCPAAAGLVLALGSIACTESDEQLVDQVGVTRLFLTHPGLLPQNIADPFERLQVARWEVLQATVSIDGASLPLVTTDAPCTFTDTAALSSPVAEGPCSTGIVIESSNEPFQILLQLTLGEVRVQRANPPPPERMQRPWLPTDPDFDGDGDDVLFDEDNCPFVSNADQGDDNGNGIGNACEAPPTSGLRDSDGDDDIDSSDNCVWNTNPAQVNTTGAFGGTLSDGIGNACDPPEEPGVTIVNVQALQALGPAELLQPLGTSSFLTVDFDEALDCDPGTASCTLDAAKVQLCTHVSSLFAAGGCS